MHFTKIMSVSMCTCLLLVSVGSARAELLDLTIEHYPRVYSLGVSVNYDPAGGGGSYGLFTATGWAWDLFQVDSQTSTFIYPGDFIISVVVDPYDPAGPTGVSGSLSVAGTLGNMFSSSVLTGFGFGGNDLFHVTFEQDGTAGLPPQGSPVGVILDAVSIPDSIFDDDPVVLPTFLEGFANSPTATGYSNTFYLPEPSSAAILILAGLGIIRHRRLRAHTR